MLLRPTLESLALILIEKNKAYGNSALDPLRVFSDASPDEAIRVRLDDKISRLVRGHAAGEDTLFDLIGYLFLLRIYEVEDLGVAFSTRVARVVDECCACKHELRGHVGSISERVVSVCKNRRTNPVYAIVELTALLIELRGG